MHDSYVGRHSIEGSLSSLMCSAATEDDPVSICSYCSDSHAGVRWAVHPSTLEIYPYGAYHIDLKFTCSNLTTVRKQR